MRFSQAQAWLAWQACAGSLSLQLSFLPPLQISSFFFSVQWADRFPAARVPCSTHGFNIFAARCCSGLPLPFPPFHFYRSRNRGSLADGAGTLPSLCHLPTLVSAPLAVGLTVLPHCLVPVPLLVLYYHNTRPPTHPRHACLPLLPALQFPAPTTLFHLCNHGSSGSDYWLFYLVPFKNKFEHFLLLLPRSSYCSILFILFYQDTRTRIPILLTFYFYFYRHALPIFDLDRQDVSLCWYGQRFCLVGLVWRCWFGTLSFLSHARLHAFTAHTFYYVPYSTAHKHVTLHGLSVLFSFLPFSYRRLFGLFSVSTLLLLNITFALCFLFAFLHGSFSMHYYIQRTPHSSVGSSFRFSTNIYYTIEKLFLGFAFSFAGLATGLVPASYSPTWFLIYITRWFLDSVYTVSSFYPLFCTPRFTHLYLYRSVALPLYRTALPTTAYVILTLF